MYNKKTSKDKFAQAIIGMGKKTNEAAPKQQYKLASSATEFERSLETYIEEAKAEFRKKVGLTESAISISKRENLNDDEIDRFCQALNNAVYKDLFAKSEGQADRYVKFKIAKPEDVKKAVNGSTSEKLEVKQTMGDEAKLEKKASFQGALDALMSIDASAIEGKYSPAAAPKAYGEFLLNKVAFIIAEDLKEKEDIEEKLASDREMLGFCFAKYASMKNPVIDTQKVFEKMCCESGMRKIAQKDIRDEFERFRGPFKIASDFSLELVSIDDVEDFSLGKHSISKIAEEVVAELPEVVDKKREVKDFEKLVQMAIRIQENDQMLDRINEKIEAKRKVVDANDEVLKADADRDEKLED